MDRKVESESLNWFGRGGPTIPLENGICIEELKKSKGQELEFSTDLLEEQMQEMSIKNKMYFDDMKGISFLLDGDSDQEGDGDMPWFQRINRKMHDISSDGGIKKMIKKEGVGPVVMKGARVKVHYSGYIEDLDEPYDSSRLRSSPLEITLGKNEVIEGLDFGISTMRQNEVSRFLIQPPYAYGAMGCPPRIPANAAILFEVELLSFSDSSILDDFLQLSKEEKRSLPFKRVLAVCKEVKAEGNALYIQEYYKQAIKKYMRVVNILESTNVADQAEEEEMMKSCIQAYMNMALCHLKLGHFGKALAASRRVLDGKKEHPKALYVCGKSLRHMGDFRRSRHYLLRARQVAPSSRDVAVELRKLDESQVKFSAVEKEMYRNMFVHR